MIPVHLLIEGLYAYRQTAEIEFGPLLDAHLFGIFGSVGSGKSSLLDAITFALYGRVERLNQRESLAANLINLEASRARIIFTFDSTRDQRRYRVTAIGKRTKSAASFSRSFERLDPEGAVPVQESDIQGAVGLSYEHFTRTVIVPQGKFQDFLMLTDKDRTAMLEELFRLERFDLSGPLARLRSEALTRETALSAQIAMLQERTGIPEQELEEQILLLSEEHTRLGKTVTHLEALCLEIPRFLQQHALILTKGNELAIKEAEKVKLEQEGPEISSRFLAAEMAWKDAPALREAMQWAELVVKARALEAMLMDTRETLRTLDESLRPLRQSLADLQSRIEILREEVKVLETDLAQPDLRREWQEALSAWKQAEGQRRLLAERGKAITADRDAEQVSARAKTTAHFQHAGILVIDQTDLPALLLTSMADTEKAIADQQAAIETLQRQAGLDLYIVDLREGTACPLCGSVHHPQVHQPGSLPSVVQSHKEALQQLRDREQMLRDAERVLRDAATRWQSREEELKRLREAYRATDQQCQSLLSRIGEAFSHPDGLQAWLDRQAKLETALRDVRKNLDAQTTNEVTLIKQIESLQENGQALRTRLAESEAGKATLLAQIPPDWLLRWQDSPDAALETFRRDNQQLLAELELGLDKARNTRDIHLRELQSRQSALAVLNSSFQELQSGEIEIRRRLASLLGGESLPDIAELEAQLPERQTALQETKERHARISGDLRLVEDQLIRLRSELNQRRNLEADHARLAIRLAHLNTLDRLFRGKGLVQYAAARYLRQIIEHANQRFHRMTRQKLRMELGEDNRIMVRDYYHGGALRHIKSLSGGQLFQASLALALSLAEYIRQYREGQRDFFFLDEGFGTQDRESLLIVLDTLRALRLENRSVGLISHVEELKQEVGAYLNIHLDPEKGSQITSYH